MNQLRVYRNRVHFANIPVAQLQVGIAQVPWEVICLMQDFARAKTAQTRYDIWSWEWQKLP